MDGTKYVLYQRITNTLPTESEKVTLLLPSPEMELPDHAANETPCRVYRSTQTSVPFDMDVDGTGVTGRRLNPGTGHRPLPSLHADWPEAGQDSGAGTAPLLLGMYKHETGAGLPGAEDRKKHLTKSRARIKPAGNILPAPSSPLPKASRLRAYTLH